MPLAPATRARLTALGLPITEDAPLAARVSWKVGGPADGFVEVRDRAAESRERVALADLLAGS